MAWHDQSWPRSHGQLQLVVSGRGRGQTGIFLGQRDPPPAPQGCQGPVPMPVLFLGAWGDRRDMPLPRDRRASVMLGAAGDTAPCPPPALGMVGAEWAAPGTGSCQTSAQPAGSVARCKRCRYIQKTRGRMLRPSPLRPSSWVSRPGLPGWLGGAPALLQCWAQQPDFSKAPGPWLLAPLAAAARGCFSPAFVTLAARRSWACLSPLRRRQLEFI